MVSKTTTEQPNQKIVDDDDDDDYGKTFQLSFANTYRLLSKRSRPTDCDVLNLYNTAKNCILYPPIHLKIELALIQHLLMRSLCLAMVYHTVDNNLNDMMNHLVLNYQVFRLIYRRYDKPKWE